MLLLEAFQITVLYKKIQLLFSSIRDIRVVTRSLAPDVRSTISIWRDRNARLLGSGEHAECELKATIMNWLCWVEMDSIPGEL